MLCCLDKENYYLNNTTKQTQKIKTLKFVCRNVECEINDIICVVKEKKILYIFSFICTMFIPKSYYYFEFLYINLILNLTLFLLNINSFLFNILNLLSQKLKYWVIVLEVRCGGSYFYNIEYRKLAFKKFEGQYLIETFQNYAREI